MCDMKVNYTRVVYILHTPPKANMEPENAPLKKEKHLSTQPPILGFHVVCILVFGMSSKDPVISSPRLNSSRYSFRFHPF